MSDTATVITGSSSGAGGSLGSTRVESADEVVAKIVFLIENPVPELYTSPAQAELVKQYFQYVGLFEENMARRWIRARSLGFAVVSDDA